MIENYFTMLQFIKNKINSPVNVPGFALPKIQALPFADTEGTANSVSVLIKSNNYFHLALVNLSCATGYSLIGDLNECKKCLNVVYKISEELGLDFLFGQALILQGWIDRDYNSDEGLKLIQQELLF